MRHFIKHYVGPVLVCLVGAVLGDACGKDKLGLVHHGPVIATQLQIHNKTQESK